MRSVFVDNRRKYSQICEIKYIYAIYNVKRKNRPWSAKVVWIWNGTCVSDTEQKLRIGTLTGSLWQAAFSTKLAQTLPAMAPDGVVIAQLPSAETIAHFDRDALNSEGVLEPIRKIYNSIHDVDGMMTVSPEYYRSIPAALTNALDWLSRLKSYPRVEMPTTVSTSSRGFWVAHPRIRLSATPFRLWIAASWQSQKLKFRKFIQKSQMCHLKSAILKRRSFSGSSLPNLPHSSAKSEASGTHPIQIFKGGEFMKHSKLLTAMFLTVGATTAAYAAPITLRFAVSVPPQVHYNREVLIPWAEQVSKDSEGTLKVQMYFSGTLGKAGQFVQNVEAGAADIAMDIVAYYPGRFPRTDVAQMPGIIKNDAVKASTALWEMYEEGDFDEDFKGLKLLAISTPTAAMLMTTHVPVVKPEDAKGLKIGAGGRLKTEILDTLGAATINLEVFGMYQPLDRGVVDGAITHFTGIAPFKLNDVGKYYTEVPLGGSFTPVFMSQARFDSLPDAAKKAIEKNSGLLMSQNLGRVWQNADQQGKDMAVASGGELIVPDEATLASWREVLQPVTDRWVSEGDGRQELIDSLEAHLAE
ncbi:hypothetical protein FGG78_09135 [Thioclava sp. BHET1]|nr:hypothetical protein FGG78_09135 [Thioclava sp. BHET1]